MQPPQCRSPHHPEGLHHNTMILLGETATYYEFGCTACKDIAKVLSVQVRTKPAYQQHLRQLPQIRKAHEVRRDTLKRITYFR